MAWCDKVRLVLCFPLPKGLLSNWGQNEAASRHAANDKETLLVLSPGRSGPSWAGLESAALSWSFILAL